MQKQITRFEIKKGERIYHLLMDSESPIGELHDVLIEMREHVIQAIQKTIEMQKSQIKKEEESPPDARQ
jgi:hypothetical protein